MEALVVIACIILLIIVTSRRRKKSDKPKRSNTKSSKPHNYHKSMDDTIIDITGKAVPIYQLDVQPILTKYEPLVPYWSHQYVYRYDEIEEANNDQVAFYQHFKDQFLRGVYLDLEGNTNYAFILLFDLLNEFKNHSSLGLLEKQIKILGQCYPKTKSYGLSFLSQKMEMAGDNDGATRIKNEKYASHSYEGNYWGLGTKYGAKLGLKIEEIDLLNKLYRPDNNFCSIEYCLLEVIKFYLLVLEGLREKFASEGSNLQQQLDDLADIVATKELKYKRGTGNYQYSLASIVGELHSGILRHCENAVREKYGHKRKLNTEGFYSNKEVKGAIEEKLYSKLPAIFAESTGKINPPDEDTEIELYGQNTVRWKIEFEAICRSFGSDPKKYYTEIIRLGNLNKKNPSIENIFFEASKYISKKDKKVALSLYIYYLYYDLRSQSFDNKQLTKTIQKNLFKTNEQLRDFEIIVNNLIKEKKLEKALKDVPNIYKSKRRRILLDSSSIKEVKLRHSGTVDLLNEYLKDELDSESNTIRSKQVSGEEVEMQIIQKGVAPAAKVYLDMLQFTDDHVATLDFFVKHSFAVVESELENFARSRGLFTNQLIDSINEICYECLDDLLIEEEDDYYNINPEYYQQILAK